tara:strand:- start:6065 stop:7432 length:1368 start_codon:yes stop_codon:yes gene_type:complete
MRNLFVLGIIAAALSSCTTSGNGELIGVQNRPIWNPTDPYGMVYLPQGSFNMGPGDQDVPYAHVTQHKTVSVAAFYMDETEITNNEYRQFVNWVRDSIARTLLAKSIVSYDDKSGEPNEFAFREYAKWDKEELQRFTGERLNWDYKIPYDSQDPEIRDALAELYLPGDERFYNRKEIDARKLFFSYEQIEIKKASRKSERDIRQGQSDRRDFIIGQGDPRESKTRINIYPDTLVWTHDYAYSYNDPWTRNYFHHPAFDDYPVVGVNWKQAVAFSKWRTKMLDDYLLNRGEPLHDEFRLPTESEWEYAARGGMDLSPYPWGGPYTTNDKGCYLANFKPRRGNYTADGGIRTVKVGSYNPNNYGLYDMAGNVSEWTDNTYDESAFSFAHDMNMDFRYDAPGNENIRTRKTIRGGSWKDISHFIQVGTRDYEYQDTAKSYIGFRNVVSFLGRDKVDFR